MHFNIFSLHPGIFSSFFENSLIARGLAKKIISYQLINWRENFGVGNYKQVDDRPFGGGSGMVLMPGPIFAALESANAVSQLYQKPKDVQTFNQILPNNAEFFSAWKMQKLLQPGKVTVSLTARGFPINQQILEWLATNFNQLNILCGRYEGFDARVSEAVDLELSLGNFVLNGGETASMCLIEGISRLLPDFVTKETSVLHDSFSSQLNFYKEQENYSKISATQLSVKNSIQPDSLNSSSEFENLFSNSWWQENILPFIEHPQFTRPEIWQNLQVPAVLTSGDHKAIQKWRLNWLQ